jgi:hypothetical protein
MMLVNSSPEAPKKNKKGADIELYRLMNLKDPVSRGLPYKVSQTY